ncbi:MAG: D-arabinose 5-phosphate isomerase [Betaproteobacteria bacterium HGW-Betaproteobacteria-1]|jgi:arabinose-5-phosphate isomerase|nr:MAG: D-arabinose 5-phosphate isomerase [Betaproteobacteria bacterium HGW-Betaproteobacteria-1]
MEISQSHQYEGSVINSNSKAGQSPLGLAREVLLIESRELESIANRLDQRFTDAVDLILQCQGRVVVSGMGKSGHIGRKIASTLASTGTPAFFVHPGEASHGDLGMITADDLLIALSNSGESDELLSILPVIKRLGAKIISITGNPGSTLARESDIHVDAHVSQEACPLGLAPTASTTAMLALGDALALTVLDQRGFSAEDFARSHPGGSLGRRLLIHVSDIMRKGAAIPNVKLDAALTDGLLEMTRKGLGMTAIVDANNKPVGIFTDGDLRRAFENGISVSDTRMREVMHANPCTITPERPAVEAVEVMENRKINGLLVVDQQGTLVGALNMLDLLTAKVI